MRPAKLQIRSRRRRSARKWRRNGLKRSNPRPEMVWPRKPRTPKIWYALLRRLPTRPAKTPPPVEVPSVRPQMALQGFEKIESAPGNGMAPEAPDPQDMVRRRDGAMSALAPAGQTPLSVEAPPVSRQMAPQRLETGNVNPQNLGPARCEPLVDPAAANPSGVWRVNLRMTLNGVVAC